MNNLFQILIGLVIAVLLTILAAPYFIDWNPYKGEIEKQASKLLGRPLSIKGDVQLRLLPSPYLKLRDIRISEGAPDSSSAEPAHALMQADAFKLWLAAPPLLRGVIEVEGIELVKPHLRLDIDADGRTNWHGAATGKLDTRLPFTPTAVSLQSMKIIDGLLEVSTPALKAARKLKLAGLNGDFSAGSLSGPYKFDGTIGSHNDQRILRFSSGRIDNKGEMRVKALLRTKNGPLRTGFDGAFLDLHDSPKLKGLLTAAVPVFTSSEPGAQTATGAKKGLRPMEIKTAISADTKQALFEKILVTIVHKNRPQMMTGQGQLSWDKGMIDLDGALNARLLDLDHLKGGLGVGDSVTQSIENLISGLAQLSGRLDRAHFKIRLAQIKLNNDLMQGVQLDLARNPDGLKVEKLQADLPGDNRIHLSGAIAEQAGVSRFKGHGVLRGKSLGGLVNWAGDTSLDRNSAVIHSRPFSLRGDVRLGGGLWSLDGAKGDIAGTSFSGSASHEHQEGVKRGRINLNLTTSALNTTALVGRPVAIRELVEGLTKSKTDAAEPGGSRLSTLLRHNNLRLQLRAGQLEFADFDGRDLVADLYYSLERLKINEMSLRSSRGLRLQADGAIEKMESSPRGALTATVNIASADELRQITSWFEHSKQSQFSDRQIKALAPFRIAAMLQTASGSDKEAQLRINGIAGQSKINLKNRIIGDNLFSALHKTRIDQLELTGTLSNAEGRNLLTQLVPHLPLKAEKQHEIGSANIWFSAAGLPQKGLTSRLEFTSKRLSAGLDGQLAFANRGLDFKGRTRLETDSLKLALALLDLPQTETGGAEKTSDGVSLTADLDKQGSRYAFQNINGSANGSDLQGRASVNHIEGRRKLDLVMATGAMDLPALFAPLFETRSRATNEMDALAAATQLASSVEDNIGSQSRQSPPSLFSSRKFIPDNLNNLDADLSISADRLRLGNGVLVGDGKLVARIRQKKINFEKLEGKLWDGELSASGELDLSSSIALARGKVSLRKGLWQKTALTTRDGAVLTGRFSLDMALKGRGISPAGLTTLMDGKGMLTMRKGRLNRFSARVLAGIIDDELALWDKSEDQTPFKERFKRHLLHGDFDLANVKAPFTIKDGSLDLRTDQTAPGLAKLNMRAALALSNLNGHARLTLLPTKDSKYNDLPPTSVLYAGHLNEIDRISPHVETASLEQHLKVMKMEHDVEILEKLHKRDEEFARQAAKRREQQRLDAEKAAEQAELSNSETGSQNVGEPFTDDNTLADQYLRELDAIPLELSRPKPKPQKKKPPSWNPFTQQYDGMR